MTQEINKLRQLLPKSSVIREHWNFVIIKVNKPIMYIDYRIADNMVQIAYKLREEFQEVRGWVWILRKAGYIVYVFDPSDIEVPENEL